MALPSSLTDLALEQAQPIIDQVKVQVRAEAAAGARDAVRPWVLGAVALSGVALVVGLVALARGRRR